MRFVGSLTSSKKRQVLEVLTTERLRELAYELYITVSDHRVRDQLIQGLADGRRVDFGMVLEELKRDELKAMCRELGLDDGGRSKAPIIERILSGEPTAEVAEEDDEGPFVLTPSHKRKALGALVAGRLRSLVDFFELEVDDRRSRDDLVGALADGRRVWFGDVLEQLNLDELRALYDELEIDHGGDGAAELRAWLVAEPEDSVEPARADDEDAPAPEANTPRMNEDAVQAPPSPQLELPQPPPAEPHAGKVGRTFEGFSEITSFIWSVADLLRGDYKQSEYGRVILPFTVLRRLDQVLEPTRQKVLDAAQKYADSPEAIRERMLTKASGHGFYNVSKLSFAKLLDDPTHIAQNMVGFINGFSLNVRDIVEQFRFDAQIERLERANLVFLVTQKFAGIDLHPDRVTNAQMGTIFEELIRKFAEQSNETAGEHFTPREVIRFMVNLLFVEDDEALRKPGIVRTMLDPACGTGGMLSVAEDYLAELNPEAELRVFGQELNGESYAICKADMLIKGQDAGNIKYGNSFSLDGLSEVKADYLISNPPFGVDWTKAEKVVRAEHENLGFGGRFGPGLPRKNDGSLLFLLHMLSKMKPATQGGSRLAIVFNGSPLFTGAAGSGESEIRRHLLENDLLEAIVALPDQMFYNTGINTYIWVVTNRKPAERRGKVQLINGVSFFQKMRKSLGDKRKELGEEHIEELTRLFGDFAEGEHVKIFDNEDFGFHRITVERPLKLDFQVSEERLARLEDERAWQNLLTSKKKGDKGQKEIEEGRQLQQEVLKLLRSAFSANDLYLSRKAFLVDLKAALKRWDIKLPAAVSKAILGALSERNEEAEVCTDKKGNPKPDTDLRDYENVPLKEDIDAYMQREVLPHVPDAWVDHDKTKVGYEIPFTRHFYEYTPPRPLEEIEAEIRALEGEIQGMLGEVLA